MCVNITWGLIGMRIICVVSIRWYMGQYGIVGSIYCIFIRMGSILAYCASVIIIYSILRGWHHQCKA